jgi:hemerythrin-like metal-binding protein
MERFSISGLKQFLQKYVRSDELPLEARMINMIFLVGACGAVMALFTRIAMGASFFLLLVVAAIILSIITLLILANRYRIHTFCRWLTLIFICCTLFPLLFFALGGLEGTAPAYFVLSMTVIIILSNGTSRIIILILHIIEIILCYYLSSLPFFARFTADNSGINRYLDQIQTIGIAGFCIGVIIIFQTRIYMTEKEKAENAVEGLYYRDKLLRVVNEVAGMLLSSEFKELEKPLHEAMEIMARCIDVDRMYIWKKCTNNGKLRYEQHYEWLMGGNADKSLKAETGQSYIDSIVNWEENFAVGKCVNSRVSRLSPEEQVALGPFGILSILIIPIYLQKKFWGFVSFDDCHAERDFPADVVNILRSGSLLLANAVVRDAADSILNSRLAQQELMSEISQSFISRESMEVLITNALRRTGEFLKAARVLVAIADNASGESRLVYTWSSDEKWRPEPEHKGFNEIINSTFPKEVPEKGYVPTVYINDVRTDEAGKYRIMEKAGVKAFIWAPLYVDNAFWGLLSIEECVSGRIWSDSDAQLVGTLSSAISGAVGRDIMEKARAAALNQAIQASKAKGDFLSNMSHEMRTPMNAIIGMTAIGKNSDDQEKKDYAFRKIEDASTHLLGVINDILDMSKIEANKLELSLEAFEFERMLRKVADVINFKMDQRKQSFYVTIDRKIPHTLVGDDQRLSQVIVNLLSNAVKFTPDEGSIRLNAYFEGEENGLCTIRIEVTDTGIGISPEQQKRLFNSFEQAESSTTRKFGGTGLGLAISRRIVELMGGEIWIESELGKGSTFIFTVKMKRGAMEQIHTLNPGVNWSNLKILVVDDESEVWRYFADIAQRFGIRCDTASGGEEALALIKDKGPYDIYFIDWKMPGMNGMELTARIREQCGDKSVVTMISGTEWNLIADDAKAAGVDRFLAKPLFPSSIADLINECLGITNAAANGESEETADAFKGYRILLAEDVEINREIVLALLEPTALDIDCAGNGAIAVEMFKKEPEKYDMIFMDVQMPEMDGYEATRRIRAFEEDLRTKTAEYQNIPIVAMTANVFREDVEKSLAAGMNDHIGKPLNFDEVMEKLRKYLPKNHASKRAFARYDEPAAGFLEDWKYGVTWNPELATGNYKIDSQHKQIFRLMSNFVDACMNDQSPQVLQEILDFLTDYTVRHFTDEEALQLSCNYPDYMEHRKSHGEFKETISKLRDDFIYNGSSPQLWQKLTTVMVRWLVKHIKQEDFKIAEYIRQIEKT